MTRLKKIHLGSGTNVVDGWDNLDIEKRSGAIYHDLTKKLPYKDEMVDMVFSEHVIEHFSKHDGSNLLNECYRVLKIGGVLRIAWPDFAKQIDAYNSDNIEYWNFISQHVPTQVTGTKDELFSDTLFSWEHRYAYTCKHMIILLESIGFKKIKQKKFSKSDYGFDIDVRDDVATIYLEAKKIK